MAGYGNLVYAHMCCGFPMAGRGSEPHRCICPPRVRIEQYGYDCKHGNPMACIGMQGGFIGGDITQRLDDPKNMMGGNFSKTKDAFMQRDMKAWLGVNEEEQVPFMMSSMKNINIKKEMLKIGFKSLAEACRNYDGGPFRANLVEKCKQFLRL